MLANFIGISGALLLPSSDASGPGSHRGKADTLDFQKPNVRSSQHLRYLIIAAIEVTGNIFGVLGLIFAGSGLFQVVYSSVVLFTALMSKAILKRSPQPKQWIALFLITLGLAASAVGGWWNKPVSTQAPDPKALEEARTTMIGMVFTLLCATLYASSYVMVEWVLNDATDPPVERDIQAYAGLYGLCIISIYIMLHTVPNWSTLVTASIAAKHGSPLWVFITYAALSFSSFLHGVSYYKLVRSIGAVSTGVLQSLRAVSVFGISSLAFCGQHSEQCINSAKVISMIVVSAGLIGYSHYAVPKKVAAKDDHSDLLEKDAI